MEIMLVDDRSTRKPLRSKNKVKRLTQRGLSNIISAYQKCAASEINSPLRNAPEIRDFQPAHAHFFPPQKLVSVFTADVAETPACNLTDVSSI
jgi:hypothetical protein